jgi:thiol-disulfide isomerase/thioredoxin
MAYILDVLNRYFLPYKRFILVVAILAVFVYAIRYWMNTHAKTPSKFTDVANSTDRSKEVVIYFFHADWCPHCKKAEPEWNAFRASHHDKVVNGYTINCHDVNCTDENNTASNTLINKFNVDSYPTVKMERDGTIIDFDSKVTASALSSFSSVMLGD